jgi:hypothetical protein
VIVVWVRWRDGRQDWLSVDEYTSMTTEALRHTRVRFLRGVAKA